MKTMLIAISIISIFRFSKCQKENRDSNGLPPATQEGKNTLGFLLNGKPWKPQGSNGTANLSIDYDAGINNGGVGISAYRIISSNEREYFGMGIIDSLNFFHHHLAFHLKITAFIEFVLVAITVAFFQLIIFRLVEV